MASGPSIWFLLITPLQARAHRQVASPSCSRVPTTPTAPIMAMPALCPLVIARSAAVCSGLRCSAAGSVAGLSSAAAGASSGEEQLADAAGSQMQKRGTVVEAPASGDGLADPAAPDAPLPLLQRASQALQVRADQLFLWR